MENNNYLDMELLRFTTAGSVDDGKSTLIGRLLYDSKAIFEDQLIQVQGSSERKGLEYLDLSLITDGLKDEREQGITIDVAYRYFATPKRKFIIADTPGHIQYTRNMVTGASTANAALILIDARKGVIEQTYRHTYLASLLKIPHIIVCVNKMDLVEFNESAFNQITQQFESFATKLNLEDIQFIPISALHGDNIVNNSLNMPWYSGDTLLQSLETIHIGADENLNDTRFAVKMAINPINVIFIILRIMFGWFNEKSLNMHSKYIIKHATSEVICRFEEINYQIDINTLAEDSENKQIDMNTNFKARITMNMELFTDAYKNNRNTGSIIIITEATNETVAGGMIVWI